MTKAEMRRIAQRARRYGHFRDATSIALDCPLCRERVTETYFLHAGTVVQQLDAMMLDHLDGYCSAVAAPPTT